MSQPTATSAKFPGTTSPSRATTIRRFAVRVLWRMQQYSDFAFAAAFLAVMLLWTVHQGPAWITGAELEHIVLSGAALYGLNRLYDLTLENLAELINPDIRDGDIVFAIAREFADLQEDILNGADTDDVLDNLAGSRVLTELADALRALASIYAVNGEEDEAQRLRTAVDNLRKAERNVGYLHTQDPEALNRYDRP